MLKFINQPFTNKTTIKGAVAIPPKEVEAVSSIHVILKGFVILQGVSSELLYHNTEEISLESGNSKGEFPFALSFPSHSLLPSMASSRYSVEYTLEAVVKRHSLFHKTNTERVALTYIPSTHPPTDRQIMVTREFRQFGDTKVQLSIPNGLFQAPEPLDIHLNISSKDPLTVSRVTLTAESKTRWRVPGYRVMDNVCEQVPIAAASVDLRGTSLDLSHELSQLMCHQYLPPTFTFPKDQRLPHPEERGQARSKVLGIAREYDLIVQIEGSQPMEIRHPVKVLSPYLSGARADSPELPPAYFNERDAARKPAKGLYLHDLQAVRHQMLPQGF